MNLHGFDTDLQTAIAGLYETFEHYSIMLPLDACDCCIFESDQDQLVARPLRLLTSEDLSYYASKAITTFGTVEDFKHFLPRLFELMATEPRFPKNCEIVFGKLPYASWRRWPAEEQRAIERFLRALWRHELEAEEPAMSIDACLGSIARVMEDLGDFLQFWSQAMERSPTARRRMAEFIAEQQPYRDTEWPFWEEIPDRQRQVIDWLRHPSP